MANRNAVDSILEFNGKGQPEIENASLLWRNFAGAEKQFNPAGKRTVNVILSEQMYEELKERGYNVKEREPRQDGDDLLRTLEVEVKYKDGNRPPKMILITGNSRNALNADTVAALDFSIIVKADLIINPYNWTMYEGTPREVSGVKAYLEAGYFTIETNKFDEKYGDLDEGGPRADSVENAYPQFD